MNITLKKYIKKQHTLEIAYLATRAALEKKAEKLSILNTSEINNYITDYLVICTVHSTNQARTVSNEICKITKNINIIPCIEGYQYGRWVLIDLGNVITHVFLEEIRSYYKIDELWKNAKKVNIPISLYQNLN